MANIPMQKNPVMLMYIAGGLMLFLGLGHAVGHMIAISDPGDFPLTRLALYKAMSAYDMGSAFGATRWTTFKFFSLGHGFGLAFAGLATIQVANMGSAALRHRFAGLGALFWAAAGVGWMWQSPTEAALLNSVPAALLFGLAWHHSR